MPTRVLQCSIGCSKSWMAFVVEKRDFKVFLGRVNNKHMQLQATVGMQAYIQRVLLSVFMLQLLKALHFINEVVNIIHYQNLLTHLETIF